jgi:carbonic anhydrase
MEFGFIRSYLRYLAQFFHIQQNRVTQNNQAPDSSSDLESIKGHLNKGLREFLTHIHPQNLALFLGLAKEQKPHTFFISCSDSRVLGTLITQTSPGELFQLKNAGQIVFPFEKDDLSSKASIEYAIKVLSIKNIVICGHSDCGAVKALLANQQTASKGSEGSAITCYLKGAYPQGLFFKEKEPLADVIKRHVRHQCDNLKSFPFIQAGLESGELNIEGWYYDIASSQVSEVVSSSDWLQEHSIV